VKNPVSLFLSLSLLSLFLWSLPGCASLGRAQTAEVEPAAGVLRKTDAVTSDFPLWIRDLRRAEIVAFGSFPFTMFTATFVMDTYRWAAQGGGTSEEARRYAPWPFKSAGAEEMTDDEHIITMVAAASASVTIALLDYLIVQTKRHRARVRAEKLPPGTPIIIRASAAAGSGADGASGPDAGFPEDGEAGENSLSPSSGTDENPVPGQGPGSP
jgi:hypothetical protein